MLTSHQPVACRRFTMGAIPPVWSDSPGFQSDFPAYRVQPAHHGFKSRWASVNK